MKKMRIVLGAAVLGVSAVIAGSTLTGCGGSKTIDLSKYVIFEVEGYDGYGKATATFDTDKLKKDYSKVKANTKSEEYNIYKGFEYSDVEILADSLMGSLDKTDNLSNGDTVKYEIDTDSLNELFPSYKVKDVSFKVSGLKSIETFDAFADIDVSYITTTNYTDATRKINVTYPSTEGTIWKELQITTVNEKGNAVTALNAGDKFYVKISGVSSGSIDKLLDKYGKVPAELTKEYTVTSLAEYPSSFEAIGTDGLDKLKASVEEALLSNIKSYKNVTLEYQKSYLNYGSVTISGKTVNNRYYAIYKATHDYSGAAASGTATYYMIAFINNVEKDTDGVISFGDISVAMGDSNMTAGLPVSGLLKHVGLKGYDTYEDAYADIQDDNKSYSGFTLIEEK